MSTPNGPDRTILFTDAVVAIAITLLVLPLVDVVSESVAAGAPSIEVITGHQPEIYSFLLSFAVIARFWSVHHAMFEGVTAVSRGLMFCNFLWLLTIVVLPFPTEMVGGYSDDRFTTLLYIGTILASSACLTVLSVLVRGALVPAAISAPVLLAVAMLVAAFVPGVGYLALLLLLLSRPLGQLLTRWLPADAPAT